MMKKYFLFVITLCLSVPLLYAQDPVAQKYASLITPELAKKHLTILASDEFGGRETGTLGAEKAAQYIADEFKRLGLIPPVNGSYFQKVPLIEKKIEVSKFSINNNSFINGKDFYISGNSKTKSIQTNEIVFVGYGIDSDVYNDLKGVDIKDKVVLVINKGEPVKDSISVITKTRKLSDWSTSVSKRIDYLKSFQPALIIAISPNAVTMIQKYASYFNEPKLTLQKGGDKSERGSIDVINITPAMADEFLKSAKKSYETLKMEIDKSSIPKTQVIKANVNLTYGIKTKEINSANVLGYLEGSDLKDELVVFSAHYDHIGIHGEGADKINNGADDDGSGTTAVLELARAYTQAKKAGNGPRRSILFLGNVGEEKGLLGSEWYSENPVFPLANTVTDLNIDMIGRVDPEHKADTNYCYLIGSDKLSRDLHKISENANATYTKLKIDYKYNDPADPERIYYRSDHYNFAKHNIPIIFYFNGIHEDYHKPSDEVSKINFNLLVKRAQLVFYTGWELLNRDKRPVVDVVNNNMSAR